MPDLTYDKLILFAFAVIPGVIAIQVFGLRCPGPKKDLSNSLVDALTYSMVNVVFWFWWVRSLVRRPFDQISTLELTGAFVVVCLLSPAAISLVWYKLRVGVLHRRCGLDHPTPRSWEHFIRKPHDFWVLFHLKSGKTLGGYFGGESYAATYPHEPEMYVEEIWRINDRGEFIELVEGTLGGIIRISECERVEFLNVKREVSTDGEAEARQGPRGTEAERGCGADADSRTLGSGGPTGPCPSEPGATNSAEGRVRDGTAEANGQIDSH